MADDRSTHLAGKLEVLTEASIDKLMDVLRHPVDVENGPLLRAQTSAAGIGLNAQLRADSMRLRALREDKALSTLLAIIAAKESGVPCDVGRSIEAASGSADSKPLPGRDGAGITVD